MVIVESQQQLEFYLKLLKHARNILIDHFTQEEPDIYTPSFKYEQSPSQMNLAREKYLCRWLHSHWIVFEQCLQDIQHDSLTRDELQYGFSCVFLELLKQYDIGEITHPQNSQLFFQIIHEKIQVLNHILTMGDHSEERLKQLQYQYERSNVIFERAITAMKEEE